MTIEETTPINQPKSKAKRALSIIGSFFAVALALVLYGLAGVGGKNLGKTIFRAQRDPLESKAAALLTREKQHQDEQERVLRARLVDAQRSGNRYLIARYESTLELIAEMRNGTNPEAIALVDRAKPQFDAGAKRIRALPAAQQQAALDKLYAEQKQQMQNLVMALVEKRTAQKLRSK